MSYLEGFTFPVINPGRFGANPSRLGTVPSRFELFPGTPGILPEWFGLFSHRLELFSARHGNSLALLELYRRLPEMSVHLLVLDPARFDYNPKLPDIFSNHLKHLPSRAGYKLKLLAVTLKESLR